MSTLLNRLASASVIFWLMPWLMALLVVGTIAQREIGLYEAEKLFFSSWVVWLGAIPLPGLYPTLALLSLSLAINLIFKSPWRYEKSGIIITHMGALLLLLGGLMTAVSSEEGFIALADGQQKRIVSDYHLRELVVLSDGEPVVRISHDQLHSEMPIDGLPFNLEVEFYCRNCQPVMRENVTDAHRELAQKVALQAVPLEPEDEGNMAGARLRVAGASDATDGLYTLFEAMPVYPEIEHDGVTYQLAIRKQQRVLPFAVQLESFEKLTHPGTQTAREYQSQVTIDEGEGIRWKRLIRMNEPLRVQGYTLYQSSFVQTMDGQTISVLAVVKNQGRVFPYVASIVMAIGLLMHAYVRRRRHV